MQATIHGVANTVLVFVKCGNWSNPFSSLGTSLIIVHILEYYAVVKNIEVYLHILFWKRSMVNY